MDSKRHQQVFAVALVGAIAASLIGCSDNNATGPDGTGDGYALALVSDNPNQTSPSVVAPTWRIEGNSEASTYNGTITADMSVSLSADGKVWYDLGQPANATVTAQSTGNGVNVTGEVTVLAGSYTYVRLVMHNAHATIKSGAVIGGLTLATDVDVVLGNGGDLVIEKKVPPFTVTADATTRTEILFDLNSEAWITKDNVQQENASEGDVRNATQADTQHRPRQ